MASDASCRWRTMCSSSTTTTISISCRSAPPTPCAPTPPPRTSAVAAHPPTQQQVHLWVILAAGVSLTSPARPAPALVDCHRGVPAFTVSIVLPLYVRSTLDRKCPKPGSTFPSSNR